MFLQCGYSHGVNEKLTVHLGIKSKRISRSGACFSLRKEV